MLAGGSFDPACVGLVPLTRAGTVDCAALDAMLAASDETTLVAVQSANNETGAIQPLQDISSLVRKHGALLVVDAVQSFGRTDVTGLAALADAIIVSSHKIGGPKGVGAVILASDRVQLAPILRGGGQERGYRAGTENVAGIAGFGAAALAASAAASSEEVRLRELRDRFEAALLRVVPDAVVFARDAARLPNTSCFAVPGCRADTALIALDLEGLAVSSGSACSSGKVKSSHVLEAMGVGPDLTSGALRMSAGWSTTADDVDAAIAITDRVFSRLRGVSRAA
jgi:cysteine desulfurase